MNEPCADSKDMTWYLNKLAEEEKCILHVLLLTGDGLLIAHSDDLERAAAERLSAAMSGVTSLSEGLSEFCDKPDLPWRRSIICLGDSTVLTLGAGPNAVVAVSVDADMTSPDFSVVVGLTVKAVNSMRHLLSAKVRTS